MSDRRGRVLVVAGLVVLSWFVLFELLAPFIELFGFGYLGVGLVLLALDWLGKTSGTLVPSDLVWTVLAVAVLYAIALTLVALLVE